MIGMKVTFRHLFVPAVTIQYPTVKPALPERERNRLYVNMDDCIGCDQCSRACPVSCIEIETVKSVPGEDLGKTSNEKKKALWVTKFNIDFATLTHTEREEKKKNFEEFQVKKEAEKKAAAEKKATEEKTKAAANEEKPEKHESKKDEDKKEDKS
jgi:NADH-quinone oxidoreductase subunit I